MGLAEKLRKTMRDETSSRESRQIQHRLEKPGAIRRTGLSRQEAGARRRLHEFDLRDVAGLHGQQQSFVGTVFRREADESARYERRHGADIQRIEIQ